MRQDLVASGTVKVNASPARIWKVLTNPGLMKEYLYGTETITDWKPGNDIIFQGEYKGQKYRDKGIVQENNYPERLSYKYWSAFTGLEDKPENYSLVTCTISEEDKNQSILTWAQKGFGRVENFEHCQKGMPALLQQIKEIAERQETSAS